jgi:hypothetical protein
VKYVSELKESDMTPPVVQAFTPHEGRLDGGDHRGIRGRALPPRRTCARVGCGSVR